MRQRVLLVPKKYTLGTDISEERYNEVLLKLVDWLSESRKTKEPAVLARQLIQECLDGETKDGRPWHSAASATLEARIRAKCRFDIETMQPLRTASEKNKAKKDRERARKAIKRGEGDTLIPDELRKELRTNASYGDDPTVFLSTAEAARWKQLHESYTTQFPELATVNASAELDLLCDLHVLSERHRLKVLQGQAVDPRTQADVLTSLQDLKKALGVHPDQLAKRNHSKVDASIGAAAARLEAMGDWRLLRQRFWAEELLQAFQMYMTPNAQGTGYQLDEVGLFGLTRSRPHDCPKCGQRSFSGIAIEEIEQWLVEHGHLVAVT